MAHAITSMKSSIVLLSSFLFCSCANMFVTSSTVGGAGAGAPTDTKDFASGGIHMVTNCGVGASAPKAIYIRPFCIDTAVFKGDQADSDGEMPIRKALTPVQFASRLKEQLEKIAPARVIKDDEAPRTGWLVDGEFTLVDGGSRLGRYWLGRFYVGQSFLAMHVRITDVVTGGVVYEFDVAGGSRWQGRWGTVRSGGAGFTTPFDLQNAAERIYLALSPDAWRYGARNDVSLR